MTDYTIDNVGAFARLAAVAEPARILRRFVGSCRWGYGDRWGTINRATTPAPGVMWADCSGHGGLLVVDDPTIIDSNRVTMGGTETVRWLDHPLVHVARHGRRTMIATGTENVAWARAALQQGAAVASFRVWVGEHDDAWRHVYRGLNVGTRDAVAARAGFVAGTTRQQLDRMALETLSGDQLASMTAGGMLAFVGES